MNVMNRAERRRLQKKQSQKEPVYNISSTNLNQIKQKATKDAVSVAFKLMLGIPTMVLHDKYGWGGKKRLPEFGEYVLDLYDSFEKGYVTLEDIEKCIYEETGISFQE